MAVVATVEVVVVVTTKMIMMTVVAAAMADTVVVQTSSLAVVPRISRGTEMLTTSFVGGAVAGDTRAVTTVVVGISTTAATSSSQATSTAVQTTSQAEGSAITELTRGHRDTAVSALAPQIGFKNWRQMFLYLLLKSCESLAVSFK